MRLQALLKKNPRRLSRPHSNYKSIFPKNAWLPNFFFFDYSKELSRTDIYLDNPREPYYRKKLIVHFFVHRNKKNIMSSNNCTNNYVHEYVSQDLSWYKRDSLITWYDQVKCQEFLKNSNSHFKTAKIINFDIVKREAAGEMVSDNVLKKYQTVQNKMVSNYIKTYQDKFLDDAFRIERLDIFFEKN